MASGRVVVAGATSFIGIALIKELEKNGYEITAIIRPYSKRTGLIKRECPETRLVECDITNYTKLADILGDDVLSGGVDAFYQIGWSSDFANARYNIEGQLRNVTYILDSIRAAKELGCTKFLAVGSQAECGLVGYPINSQTCDNPITAYAKAKCEAYIKGCELCKTLGIDFYWPRLLSAYGMYDRSSTLIMSCIDACINHREIAMTKAEQIWDYVHVSDVAKALRLIVSNGKPRKKYSIASGVGRPLAEYIHDVAEVFEFPELINGLGKREYSENEVMYLVGDVSELQEDTGMVFDTDFKKHLIDMRLNLQENNEL